MTTAPGGPQDRGASLGFGDLTVSMLQIEVLSGFGFWVCG